MSNMLKTLLASALATTLGFAASTAAAADKEIAVIVKTANSDFWQNVKKGANDGVANAKGYTTTFQGAASDTDLAGQVALVENAVNRKVAGIVLAPSDPDALIPAIKKAWEAKIPVILIDSAASDAGKDYYQSFLATDNKKAGDVITFLNASPGKPTLNNAYQERYMPGSAFKIVTTSIALGNNTLSLASTFANETQWTPPQTNNPIQNYQGELCGGNMAEVFARSCNTPFARTGAQMGADVMVAGTKAWGIGETIPFDLAGGAVSHFGEVADFKDAIQKLAISSFGQDNDLIVPLQMAMIASTVANGGVEMQPYAIDSTLDHSGAVLNKTTPTVWKTPITPEVAATMNQLMVGVVNVGTAKCCLQLNNGIQAAAKTGTAQLNALGQQQRSHAWITAFAPADAPQYTVAVVLKGVNDQISAGTGGRLAGPIAKTLLDYALAHPLP